MSFEFLVAKSAKSIEGKSPKRANGSKFLKEPIRRFLVDKLEPRNLHSSGESSMPYALFPDTSGKSGKIVNANTEKAESDKSRRFLNEEGSMGLAENMSMDLLVSGKSLKVRSDAKSSKVVCVESKSTSKGEEVIVVSNDKDVIAESKSSKEGTSIKGNVLRSIDLVDTQDNAPLKSLSYIEYTRAEVPASANVPSDESGGAIALASVAMASLIASCCRHELEEEKIQICFADQLYHFDSSCQSIVLMTEIDADLWFLIVLCKCAIPWF
eukprot:CAMPEP_0172312790 /NCGR_PEP_ID=MMETSP1058-20130122/18555_1 /TAXON_ID=83371 /ORGANISM="Detonula confervacea, Strain CCMP 353" /LENGTH=268 /DNA_ID=CAMNT_0013026335 /DNA_START=410 /DNA_END=1216 /DNA_ORIENTATION=-